VASPLFSIKAPTSASLKSLVSSSPNSPEPSAKTTIHGPSHRPESQARVTGPSHRPESQAPVTGPSRGPSRGLSRGLSRINGYAKTNSLCSEILCPKQ
jgi:hypothetical protein